MRKVQDVFLLTEDGWWLAWEKPNRKLQDWLKKNDIHVPENAAV